MLKFKYIFIFCFLIFVNGCKKYPEDPFYSLRTSNKRLKGKWKIVKIEINGQDITSQYNDTLIPYKYDDFVFDFQFKEDLAHSGNKGDYVFVNTSLINSSLDNFDIAIWGIDNNKKDKTLSFEVPKENSKIRDTLINNKLKNLFYQNYIGWNIEKLWRDNLHVHIIKNNSSYEVYFKKQ